MTKDKSTKNKPAQNLESKLWAAANKLRGNLDAAEYKHVVLGLIFLKYISDSFQAKFDELQKDALADPEDKDEYLAENIFWVPPQSRWTHIRDNAKQPTIGTIIDDAMEQIEKENPSLKGVLYKRFAREELDKRRLGELIDLIGTIQTTGDHKSQDLLGKIYEYFLGQFANEEGKKGGEFYTPESIVKTLVAMIEPYKGRVYDPACGSGGMFVQSEKFVEEHQGRIGDIAVYGQELNYNTFRLAKMNLAIRHIDGDIRQGDTLLSDKFPDLKADFILANPPFNQKDWGQQQVKNDIRWKYGTPPNGNANFAWMQHMIHHLAPNGQLGLVLANGSLSSQSSGEGEIRKNIIEAGLIDCIVTLPNKIFFNSLGTQAAFWLISRNRQNRAGKILFIDARNMGQMVNRRNRILSDDDIAKIVSAYHNFKNQSQDYKDEPGFCKVATLDDVKEHDFVLTPGRYVGAEEIADDDEAFAEKMSRLTSELSSQFTQSHELEERIKENLMRIK